MKQRKNCGGKTVATMIAEWVDAHRDQEGTSFNLALVKEAFEAKKEG